MRELVRLSERGASDEAGRAAEGMHENPTANATIRPSTSNNFDLIRLFAATQVALSHAVEHLGVDVGIASAISYFPGVPIFFFISGYLIYQSYCNLRHKGIGIFFANRGLRLYPALYVCFFFTIVSVWLSGYFDDRGVKPGELFTWMMTSLTFFQFYNPEFMRAYGTGAINGSLWTIAVELQFYALTPLLFFALSRYKIVSAIGFSLLMLANGYNSSANNLDTIVDKLLNVSFIPWFYMFIAGAYVSTNDKLLRAILRVNIWVIVLLYLLTYWLADIYGLGVGNQINVLSYGMLIALILKVAHTWPILSDRILGKNDISYGIYIYHMPIINLFMYLGFDGSLASLVVAMSFTFAMALLSWLLIERPSLRSKKMALRAYR